MSDSERDEQKLRYRVLTGPDDRSFCERISAALDEGYQLYGSPSLTYDGDRVIVAQALVLVESSRVGFGLPQSR